jgi:hypothetical protein
LGHLLTEWRHFLLDRGLKWFTGFVRSVSAKDEPDP